MRVTLKLHGCNNEPSPPQAILSSAACLMCVIDEAGGSGGGSRDTYDDVLPRLEGADVVSVMHVVHLLQDGRHAGQIVTLRQNVGQCLLFETYAAVGSYNKRRRGGHGDDGAVHPAKEPLHYQLHVDSSWTLNAHDGVCDEAERSDFETVPFYVGLQ